MRGPGRLSVVSSRTLCECSPELFRSASRNPQEAGRSGDPGGQAVQKSTARAVLRPQDARRWRTTYKVAQLTW